MAYDAVVELRKIPPTSRPVLRSGAPANGGPGQGSAWWIRLLRRCLDRHGLSGALTESGQARGEFDLTLPPIVRLFQRQSGLTVDGIVGPQTWAALAGERPLLSSRSYGQTPEGFALWLADYVPELRNFTAAEILHNVNASRKGARNSMPPPALWINMVPTLRAVQTLRDHAASPITISSGYRNPEYNAALGGAKASQHMRFAALDIVCRKLGAAKLAQLARKLRSEGVFAGGVGQYPSFVHIDSRGANVDW